MITNDEIDALYNMISKNIKYYRIHNKSKYADEYGRISQEKLAELCNLSQSLIRILRVRKLGKLFL